MVVLDEAEWNNLSYPTERTEVNPTGISNRVAGIDDPLSLSVVSLNEY
jgi:hypothetical protein